MAEQGTDEWLEQRLGKVTASRIADVMAKGRGNAPSATRLSYMTQLLAERLTGLTQGSFTNAAIEHGTETEPQARAQFTLRTGITVEEVGFINHPSLAMAGASPDGLIDDDGLIEIKCPNTVTHLKAIEGAPIDRKYLLQMHWQMICAERKWCQFVSFDPRMPDRWAMHQTRVDYDAELGEEITTAVHAFLAELDAKEQKYTEKEAA